MTDRKIRKALYMKAYKLKRKELRKTLDKEDRLYRKKRGICYSCNKRVEIGKDGKPRSYCPRHMEKRREQDRRRWDRMNGHLRDPENKIQALSNLQELTSNG